MEKDNKGYIVYPPTQRPMITKTQRAERQTAIETALAFDKGVSRVWVTQSGDHAIVHMRAETGYSTVFGLSTNNLQKMAALGWICFGTNTMWTKEEADLELNQHFERATLQ